MYKTYIISLLSENIGNIISWVLLYRNLVILLDCLLLRLASNGLVTISREGTKNVAEFTLNEYLELVIIRESSDQM